MCLKVTACFRLFKFQLALAHQDIECIGSRQAGQEIDFHPSTEESHQKKLSSMHRKGMIWTDNTKQESAVGEFGVFLRERVDGHP